MQFGLVTQEKLVPVSELISATTSSSRLFFLAGLNNAEILPVSTLHIGLGVLPTEVFYVTSLDMPVGTDNSISLKKKL